MAKPTAPTELGGSKIVILADSATGTPGAEAPVAVQSSTSSEATYPVGWMGIATHRDDDAMVQPGGFSGLGTAKAPMVLIAAQGGATGASAVALHTDTAAPASADEGLVVRNIPSGTQTVSGNVSATQVTSPWVVSASNQLTVSGNVSATQTTSPWVVSGNVSATQVTSPWVVSASNQLTISGNVSATQVTSPWVVSASNTLTVSPLSVTALVSGSALTAMVSGAYTRSSATAAGDTGLPAFAIMNASAAGAVNTSNLAYGLYSVDASGRVWSAGTNLEAASYAAGMNGMTMMAVVTGGVPSYAASGLRFLVMDTGGALRVQPTGTVQVSGTAVQGTSPWVVSASNQLTISGNVSATQVTSPWVVSASNALTITPHAVTASANCGQSTSPWVVSGNVSATQVTSPWVVSASNQLTVSGNVSATQTTSPWIVSGNVSATVIGTATVTVVPGTGGGWSKVKYADQTTTVRTVKGSAGTLGGYYFYNPNITVSYVQMFDTSAAVTLGTTAPDMIFGVPAGAAANIEFSNGINMASAILLACTNSATGLTAPATGLDLTVFYK